jgi:hypothetical protein
MLKASVEELLARLPGPRTSRWPDGERFVEAFARGSLVVELSHRPALTRRIRTIVTRYTL